MSVTLELLHWVRWLTGRWGEYLVLTRLLIQVSGLLPISGDAEDLAVEIGDHPCVWTDGSREDYPTGGSEVAGSGVCLLAPKEEAMREATWGTAEEHGDASLERCRAFMHVSWSTPDSPTR